jgi:hypothetical protein
MSNNSDLGLLHDKLPPFIQKGNKLCNLLIYKESGNYIIKYTNATEDLLGHDASLSALASRILKKLYELEGTRGYIIDWDFYLENISHISFT